ncbi:MAG: RnfABCDGE type electron transport complex subunit D [Bacilli bacterium]
MQNSETNIKPKFLDDNEKKSLEFIGLAFLFYFVSLIYNTIRFTRDSQALQLTISFFSALVISLAIEKLFLLPHLVSSKRDLSLSEFTKKCIFSDTVYEGLLIVLLLPISYYSLIAVTISLLIKQFSRYFLKKSIISPLVIAVLIFYFLFHEKYQIDPGTSGFSETLTSLLTIDAQKGFAALIQKSITSWRLFIGDFYSVSGSNIIILTVIAGVYLGFRKLIDAKSVLTYILLTYLGFFLLFISAGDGLWSFKDAMDYQFLGSICFASVFIIGDKNNLPTDWISSLAFVSLTAFLTVVFRFAFFDSMEVFYALAISQLLFFFESKIKKSRATSILSWSVFAFSVIGIIAFSISFGLLNPINPSNGYFLN